MSINFKKPLNYTSILGDIKATSLNDKIKGRNYKMYIKRGTSSIEKNEVVSGKSLAASTTQITIDKLNENGLKYDKKFANSKGKIIVNNLMNNSQIEFRKAHNPNSNSINNMNTINNNLGNKIDIKISVNYGKNSAHAIVNSGSTSNNTNTNISSNVSTSKSKSFYHQHNHNSFLQNSMNMQAPDYLNTNYHKGNYNNHKDKLKKSMKNYITDEKLIKKKLAEIRNSSNDYSISKSISNNHKRNQSEINYYNNSLNISLMNYEKPITNNYYNAPIINKINTYKKNFNPNKNNTNHSFMYNPQLYSHFQNSISTPKKNETSVLLDSNKKVEDNTQKIIESVVTIPANINMSEFTLNKNDGHFIEVIKSIENLPSNNSIITNVNNNINQVTINQIQDKNQISLLENKMEDLLSTITADNILSDNARLAIVTKKYTIFKKTFDDYLKILNEANSKSLLDKINEGYNECMKNVISCYGKIKEKISDYDNVNTSIIYYEFLDYKNVSKKYNDLYKAYEEKNEEVKILKSKLADLNISPSSNSISVGDELKGINDKQNDHNLMNSSNNLLQSLIRKNQKTICSSSPSISNNEINTLNSVLPTETNEISIGKNRSRMMNMINQNVVDDLDAICFFDKINMRPNSASHNNIPKLDLKFLNMNQKMKEDKNIKIINPLKLEDISILADNQKLGSSNNTVVNKNQSINKSNITNNNSNLKNSITNSIHHQQYNMQPYNAKKLNSNDHNLNNKFSVFQK